jgi:hypothetical protein
MIYGTYTGPSYGSYDPADGMEAFTGQDQALARFRERQGTSGAWLLDVTRVEWDGRGQYECQGGERRYNLISEASCFPATTTQDVIELYASPDGGEPFARIVAGPRGGAVYERYS